MYRATKSLILAASLSVGLAAQTTPRTTNTGGVNAPAQVNPAPADSSLRILTPVANQKLTTNAINVRWQLANGNLAAGAPNYQVQLDAADPITTSSTEQSFAGLAPGQHTIVVRLVDANGTPIAGGSSQVQFVVAQQNQPAPAATTPQPQSRLKWKNSAFLNASLMTREEEAAQDQPLPSSASALPLLSVVGFGALIGGVISARKTRRR